MAVSLGEWESPGARRRRKRFEEELRRRFALAEQKMAAQARTVFGPPEPTPQQSPAIAAQRAASIAALGQMSRPAFNLQAPQLQPTPTLLGAGARGIPPGPLNAPATVAPPGAPGPFPFQGGRNILDLLASAGSAIGNLPLPGGPITAAPSARGGRPGATISGIRSQTVSEVAEFERSVFQPVTKPAGGFVGESLVRGAVPPGVPGRERAIEIGGTVGATVAGEVLLPTNLIPIPIVDPALARLLGITAKMVKGVTPVVLQTLSRNADSIAKAGGEFAAQAKKFVDDTAKLLPSERGAVPLGPEPPRGAQPAPEPVVPVIEQRSTVERLTEALQEAQPALRETKQLRKEELARRGAQLSVGLEQAQTGEAAHRRALSALKGEMPTADFQPVRESIPPPEVDDLKVMIRDFYVAQPRNRRIASAPTFVALDKALDGSLPNKSELILLEKVFGPEMVIALRNKRPILGRLGEEALAAISLWRAFITGGEQSIVLRQAVIPSINPLNARMTGRNVVSSLRAGVSEKQALEIHAAWQATPEWQRLEDAADRAGYRLFTKWHGAADPLAKEETFSLLENTFVGRTARQAPLLGQYLNFSERGAVTYLNGMRFELGSRYLRAVDNAIERGSDAEIARLAEKYGFKTVDKNGNAIPMNRLRELLRTEGEEDVGRTMAIFTGRGKIPAGDVTQLLSRALFSGMLQASRIQTPFLLLQKNPAVRKLVAQDIATFMGMGLSLLAAAHYSGAASVELDPRSSNFAKIRAGPLHVDPWGGFQQYVRLIAQMATGQRKVALGDIQEISRIEAFATFWDNKLAPAISLASDVIVGETTLGEPLDATLGTVKREAFNRLLPLITQDVVDAFREMGAWGGAIAAPLAWFGVGVQSYTPRAVQIAQLIGEDLERGDLGVNDDGSAISYKEVPLRRNDLAPSDQVRFDQLHPDILQEALERERRSERGAFAIQRIEELGLTNLADQIAAGEESLVPGFMDRYVALRSERAIVAELEFEGVQFPEANTEAGRLLNEYFSLRPEDFMAEDGSRDFSAWYDARASVLDKLAELDSEVVIAIRNRPILDVAGNENLNSIEQRALRAMGLRDDAPVPLRFQTAQEYNELRDFYRQVAEFRTDTINRFGRVPDMERAIRVLGLRLDKSEDFINFAVLARSGTTSRDKLRNPQFDLYLIRNREELRPFFPDLYNQRLQLAIARLDRSSSVPTSPSQGQRPVLNLATPQLSQ